MSTSMARAHRDHRANGRQTEIWIDRGGTFTDAIARIPGTGELRVAKLLSSDAAPLSAIRQLLELDDTAAIPPCAVRMGTTLATNALLERKGAECALVITRGFRDALEIGTQARPRLFDLRIEKPEQLYSSVLEVDARADRDGQVLAVPEPTALLGELFALREGGARSLAVVVLHAYRAAELEQQIGAAAAEAGFSDVSLSHEVANELGLVGRGQTTVVDAYLTPLIHGYVRGLMRELPGSTLQLMQSSGALTDAARFRGRNALLSGPAAGVVASARLARDAGFSRSISFDMGGTSTDVSRFDGQLERVYEGEVAGVRLRAPMMDVHTVASGGGSLCQYRGFRLTVGPESAGAEPGPLCYGNPNATQLTLTDVNLFLGRVSEDRFPCPLDRDASVNGLKRVAEQLRQNETPRSLEAIAGGFFEIANRDMAEAIRQVSIARGRDVRDDALVVFGGAGGQHACALAQILGIRTLLFPRLGGVLSAFGMGLADAAWHGELDAGRAPLASVQPEAISQLFAQLEKKGRSQGSDAVESKTFRRLDLRYRDSQTALTLELGTAFDAEALRGAFEAMHKERFGYARHDAGVEIVTARVEIVTPGARLPPPPRTVGSAAAPEGVRKQALWVESGAGSGFVTAPIYARDQLHPGARISAPALIVGDTETVVVDAGFELEVVDDNLMIARAGETQEHRRRADAALDPVQLEVFGNRFMSIATQMGSMLRRTAVSTNIRERLDYSCAIFDAHGGLVANAPHIPVHLGAMSESVRAVLDAHPRLRPGDVFATNDPAGGGSHLPDITVVTPVFGDDGDLDLFTASRGHHADIGGIVPGSMPPFSSSLSEEGAVFRAVPIVSDGAFLAAAVRAVLAAGPHPARNPEDNIADLQAQIAANQLGARLLDETILEYGLETVLGYMQHVQDNAAAQVGAQIRQIGDGEYHFEDALDDGTPIVVTLRVDGDRLRVDFAGSGPQHTGNLNAPRAVTVAAVIYVLRTLVAAPIPLNSGCLRHTELVIPDGSVLSPTAGAAVCGGNVETSQRIVDVLLGALGVCAASQGTMNNLTFGDESFGYYETIAGGAGAGPDFDGASGVHTHMTNTRITDPEVLEARFPVRLLEFSLRRGSGGAGRQRGGDGVIRAFELLRPLHVSILSQRRSRPPFGLAGGSAGQPGRNLHNGHDIGGNASISCATGDIIRIETPGGGGYGVPTLVSGEPAR
jgi:5-oxoprolinase (ATP-hydrolysing)